MEFLWNFGCVFAVGVPVRRGNEPWGEGEKGQKVDIVIMENVYIVKTKIQINILTLTFLQIVI